MSVTARTIDTIQAAIAAALTAQTLTGTYLTLALAESDGATDPSMLPVECANGGYTVAYQGGTWTGASAPQTTGSSTQRLMRERFDVTVAAQVTGMPEARIAADMAPLNRQLLNLLEAGLQPTSGTNYNITGIELMRPQWAPDKRGDFWLFGVRLEITEFRARS